jgi:hypothetical protein
LASSRRTRLITPDGIVACLLDLMAALPLADWLALAALPPSTPSLDDVQRDDGTLTTSSKRPASASASD